MLIGGLGLGYSALRVLQREKAITVTIVEKFKPLIDLIDLIGPKLKQKFGDRVKLIHDDVWGHLKTKGMDNYDTMFIDIWKGYGYNKDNYEFKQLAEQAKAAGKVALAWG